MCGYFRCLCANICAASAGVLFPCPRGSCDCRTECDLTQPGPDRTFVHKALSITSLLQQVLQQQRELNGGRMQPQLASIFGSDGTHSDLKAALEVGAGWWCVLQS